MADFKPTKDQQKAINAKGSVTVTAAAGSGKTAVLTKRVLNLITGENAIDADKLLIVTFTNAAAEEMRNRINQGMKELVSENPDDAFLQRQQVLLSKAKITTIDSFCIGLVRENFYSLNISPQFRPAEKSRLEEIKNKAMQETLEQYYETADADFINMLSAFGDNDSDSKTVEALLTVHEYMCSLPFPMVWLNDSVNAYNTSNPENSLWVEYLIKDTYEYTRYVLKALNYVLEDTSIPQKNLSKVAEVKNCVLNIFDALGKKDYQSIHYAVKAFENGYSETKATSLSEESRRIYNLCSKKLSKYEKKIKSRFEASYEEICEDTKKLYPIMKKFAEVLRSFDGCFMQKKTEQGVFSFADIERMALKLLVKDNTTEVSEIGKAISENFAEVMVDEYQDTNDLQDMIFRILSDDGKKLFTVGDAKQSIYRFRQANPQNFLKRIEFCSDDKKGNVITLSENFRSREGVCGFTNYIFSELMSEELGDIDYNSHNELVASAQYPENSTPCVTVDILNTGEFSEAKSAALRLVKVMKDMMLYPCVTDKQTKQLRNARYSDFVILASRRKEFPEICEVLESEGVPVWTDNDLPLCDAKEVTWALSVLKIICNPTKDVAFLSAMLSPAFGFTTEEVASLRNSTSRRLSVYEIVKKSAESGNEKSIRMLDVLNELRLEINCMPYGLFLNRMYEKTGLLAFVSAMKNGNARRANLIKLAESAAEFESFKPDGQLDAFASFIENAGKEISCPKTVSDSDDVVRLMTIHRSKGLEFPVVFLVGLTSKFNAKEQNSRLLFDRKLGIGLKITDREKRYSYSPFSREAIISASEHSSKSESIRLLYVALTRASEKLYLLFPSDNPYSAVNTAIDESEILLYDNKSCLSKSYERKDNFADMILTVLAQKVLKGTEKTLQCTDDGQESVCILESYDGQKKVDVSVRLVYSVVNQSENAVEEICQDLTDEKTVQSIKKRLDYVYPYGQLNEIASKYAVTSMLEKTVDREYLYSSRPSFESAKGLTPSERGTAMHRFLEVADFNSAEKDIESEVNRLCSNGYISDVQGMSLELKKLTAFFESDLYKRIKNADKVYREYRFMTEESVNVIQSDLPDKLADRKIVIQGIADCIIEENGALTIIDYKTDRVKDVSILRERYSEQLEIYSKCIEKCLKKPVTDCIIYSLFKNESVNLRKV